MLRLSILIVLAAVAAGCTTIYGEDDTGLISQEARLAMDVQNLQARVDRLQERVLEMDQERQLIYRQMEQLEIKQETARRDQEARVRSVETAMSGYESARQRDRDEVVATLSQKMAEIVRAQPAPTARPRVMQGYEHVVKSGETLSAIASAYGVRTTAIIEANDLKNPNALRAGQKLFIPE